MDFDGNLVGFLKKYWDKAWEIYLKFKQHGGLFLVYIVTFRKEVLLEVLKKIFLILRKVSHDFL